MTGTAPAKAAISWSGGKDACLALLRAREAGVDVVTFVTLCDENGASKSHGLPPELIAAQVGRLAGSAWDVRVGAQGYDEAFRDVLARLVASGHSQMVFGDIDLQAHRDWLEPRCHAAGIEPLFPLWGEPRNALAAEVLRRGIVARVVAVDLSRLPATLCGATYDQSFLTRLPAGVCPCGEDGEFHTFVTDAPGMTAPVSVCAGTPRVVEFHFGSTPLRVAMDTLGLATR